MYAALITPITNKSMNRSMKVNVCKKKKKNKAEESIPYSPMEREEARIGTANHE